MSAMSFLHFSISIALKLSTNATQLNIMPRKNKCSITMIKFIRHMRQNYKNMQYRMYNMQNKKNM